LAPEKWYSIQEAADFLGISAVTLRRYIKSRKIDAYRIASRYRFKKEALEEFLEACRLSPKKKSNPPVEGIHAAGEHTIQIRETPRSTEDLADSVLQGASRQARSLFIKAFTASRVGRYDEAEAYYHKIIQQQPKQGAAYFFLGLLYQEIGKQDLALQMWREVVNIDRTSDLAAVARYHITRALRNK
jgi:excisionase family DNA binding protein